MLRRTCLAATTLLLLLAPGHPSAQTMSMKTLMQNKLTEAQRLLGALVAVDYAAISRSANVLGRITETEIVSWQLAAQAEYARQATYFVLSVRGLQDAAAKRNIDAAIADYTTLVSSCTRCHAHVQRVRAASL